MKRISVRWITNERKVRISKPVLDEYLRNDETSCDRVQEGLTKFYKARLIRARIAAGVDNVAAQGLETIYEIDVIPGTWLDDILQQHAIGDVPTDIGRPQPQQNPDPPEPRPQPERKAQANGKAAS